MVRILPYVEQEAAWNSTVQIWTKSEPDKYYPFDWWNTVTPAPAAYPVGAALMPVYSCPTDQYRTGRTWNVGNNNDPIAFTDYTGCNGTNRQKRDGVLYCASRVRFSDITDGTSQTLMVCEHPPSADLYWCWWANGWGINGSSAVETNLGSNEIVLASDGWYSYFVGCLTPNFYQAPNPKSAYIADPNWPGPDCDTLHYWSHHDNGANFLLCDGSVHFITYNAGVDGVMTKLATRAGNEAFNPADLY
jgi:prepilin-type processing-associated H-X9-DG protein